MRDVKRVLSSCAVVLLAALFVRLGFWQLARRAEVSAQERTFASRSSGPPVEMPGRSEDRPYLKVVVRGTYDPGHQHVLLNRPKHGRNGDHVLTPLRLDDGRALVVDRGFVPNGTGVPAPPPGPVEVTGLLWPADPPTRYGVKERGALKVSRVDIGQLALPYRAEPVYLHLLDQEPASVPPEPAAPPVRSSRNNLSYAVQWFSFAAIALGGHAAVLRRQGRSGRLRGER
jgi:cytochrome oxidase assembly protein ShyY1